MINSDLSKTNLSISKLVATFTLILIVLQLFFSISSVEASSSNIIKEGDNSVEVKLLKNNLNQLGFKVTMNYPNRFGPATTGAVKKFQSHYGFKSTGHVDSVMTKRINQLLNSAMKEGQKSTEIKKLKENLNKLGFKVTMNYPNNYGPATTSAVKSFQKKYKLPISGLVEETTLNKLNQLTKGLGNVLYEGQSSSEVRKVKENLNKLGFKVAMNYPNRYGPATTNAVKSFQKKNNLNVTGTVDEVMLKKIKELLNQIKPNNPIIFKEGQSSNEIRKLKENLNRLGFNVALDYPKKYGPATTKAVKEFQKAYKLTVTGSVNQTTLDKIKEMMNKPLVQGDSSNAVKRLKEDLNYLGYFVSTNYPKRFGQETTNFVKQFQKDHGLSRTGKADINTLNEISKQLSKVNGKVRIFIDPGHGGTDPGAGNQGYKEKEFTLDIAKQINMYLSSYSNAVVLMSRSEDETLSLNQRTQMANSWKADFFFSVHINSFTNGTANGFESYIINKNPTHDEKQKQNIIHKQIIDNIDANDRGKKSANFHVLRESNMTALLVEYLFISNSSDLNKLKSKSYRKTLARHTADGIAKAYNLK